MKLYKEESSDVIYQMQNRDPFFHYLRTKVEAILRKYPQGRVLDLGCGSGRNSILAAAMGYEVVGVDKEKSVLAIARNYAKKEGVDSRVRFIHGDILRLPIKTLELFDVCILQEVIEHTEDYQRVIDIAYQRLNPGGVLILSTPHDPAQWNRLDDYAEHVRRFTLVEIRQALRKFQTVKIFTVGFPFHRCFISLYDLLLRSINHPHQARTFRQSSLFRRLYYLFGSAVLRIDDLFTFVPYGTTIFARAHKSLKVKWKHE